MKLIDWITAEKMSVAAAARAIGILGVNPGRTLDRIATGERQPDADMVARIERLTCGAVTAADMHATRLDWLMANRPEKFADAPAQSPEAAE
jgi:DNA-binding transcriptional regulator YdaS (Cro superfamily)